MNITLLTRPLRLLTGLTLTVMLSACGSDQKNSDTTNTADISKNSQPLSVPDGFGYQMNRDLMVRIQVLDHNGQPADRVGVQISEASDFTPADSKTSAPTIAPRANLISRGQTDQQGYFEQTLRLPGHAKQVVVQVSQLGIANRAVLDINGSTLFHEFK